jgi:hypothetical protein
LIAIFVFFHAYWILLTFVANDQGQDCSEALNMTSTGPLKISLFVLILIFFASIIPSLYAVCRLRRFGSDNAGLKQDLGFCVVLIVGVSSFIVFFHRSNTMSKLLINGMVRLSMDFVLLFILILKPSLIASGKVVDLRRAIYRCRRRKESVGNTRRRLLDVLEDPPRRDRFRLFLEKEFSSENLFFWMDVKRLESDMLVLEENGLAAVAIDVRLSHSITQHWDSITQHNPYRYVVS